LRGNVAVPGRYPWHPGMRVHDLIPTRESLVTEEYWEQQNQLAVTAQTPDVHRTGPAELKNEVKRLSAEINWDYAVVQRFNLEKLSSQLLPFNLAKAIEGDESQNLPLQPGDVITIFSQADIQVPIGQQSKFVRLEGEFAHSGVYQVQPGETLRQLVSRVGGLTPQSYLFGAEFNRESTRVDQQKQLNQYILTLEQAIERNASASVAVSVGDASQRAEARVRLDAQRNLLAKLKLLRATGRVVLEIRPNAAGSDALPDLVLLDGDRLLIPFCPATVNVIGQVYNSNAFLFKPGRTVGDYLRLAGGPTRDGDKGREFVIRADGSSVSRQQRSFLISVGFDSLRLMPGDTIVVPEKLDRGALMRGFKDWTQVITSFVLGAAAAKVLFP
jgi:polysaccharide biosynthesis/export protein